MPKFKYEIEYLFQTSKDNPGRIHWMYTEVEARTLSASKTKAIDYYNKQVRECGWTKFCTLQEIRPITTGNTPPKHKTVVEEKPKPKTRRRSPTRKKPVTKAKKK